MDRLQNENDHVKELEVDDKEEQDSSVLIELTGFVDL